MTDERQADHIALREQVRSRYAKAALTVLFGPASSCCEPADADADRRFGAELYDPGVRAQVPPGAAAASLGCGNPIAVTDLRPGETVLDLGSGGGIDVLLSARRVGPTGKAYGLDMTDEMLQLAARNAAEAGVSNVEFVKGHIEDIPMPAGSVDVVISNCVVNLSVDKPAVFASVYRVLRPGGRLGVSDVVAEDHLSAADRARRGGWAGCVAGALSTGEYRAGLAAAGFADIEIEPTHQVADGMHAAIIRAVKPAL
ncbi:arsenite methyltransferase [Dactylosporangium sp. NBC_01737]|uniref:arsenite methyltransferase n=1 Tax=Dactylosporangium sp. NBC_01737 TaxID=2975959 RepID=UPI002E0E8512|nr:arsenite methyltransferase [Dactylosporangium sp. NBC_01737]